jgi:hypothetical protein
MPSRRDLLKATAGLVLATGGTWLAAHARGATLDLVALSPQSARTLARSDSDAVSHLAPRVDADPRLRS